MMSATNTGDALVQAPTVTDIVRAEAPRRIRAYLQTREDWNLARDMTQLSSKVAEEYEGRFVLELIQNAYDAHPAERRDGFVHVRLDATTGSHGTLYVANGGRPFTFANFEALTNLSRSNKPPGEGIGNKGLGFRSVLQVCDTPEVYSCDPDHPHAHGFDGYCFRFATDDDIRALTTSVEDFGHVRDDVSRYFLPVPTTQDDPQLERLRQLGAVTVIRLPLRSAVALQRTRAQLLDTATSAAPTILFLERLHSLNIELIEEDGSEETTVLKRVEHPLAQDDPSIDLAEVSCGDERYLVATRRLPHAQVLRAIEMSVTDELLDRSWLEWQGDAEVSIAVRLLPDPASTAGPFLRYTYLPMEDAAPLAGHVNAPFFTKLARTHADTAKVPLNQFLLDSAADLCVATAVTLTTTRLSARHFAAVDLISWDNELDRLLAAAERAETPLEELPVVPAVTADGQLYWSSLRETYDWESTGDVLTPKALAGAGAAILHPDICGRRRERLHDLHASVCDLSMSPLPDELALWVEAVARQLAQEDAPAERWLRYYQELVAAFPGSDGEALQRKQILIDSQGGLRTAGPPAARAASRPTVFFPPRSMPDDLDEATQEEVELPANLQRAVCFLHPEIPLLSGSPPQVNRTDVAVFLEKNRLVERFNRRSILEHLRRLIRRREIADSTRAQVLRWTHQQHSAARDGLSQLDRLDLYVPTRAGWVPASQATFSATWPGTHGEALESFLALTEDESEDLRAIGRSLLLPPDEWPFRLDDPEGWTAFLADLGVRDGLWPHRLETPQGASHGGAYDPASLSARVSLPSDISRAWIADVRSQWQVRSVWHPYTPYYSTSALWVIPGQDIIERLGIEAREAFAHLLVLSLPRWPVESLRYHFQLKQGHRSGPNRQEWPTPVSTFLRRGCWFPTVNPGRRDEISFVAPSDGWHFSGADGAQAPRYAPLCPLRLRLAIERSPQALQRLKQHGLRVWDERGTAAVRLTTIAELVLEDSVRSTDAAQVRNAYQRAWTELAVSTDAPSVRLPLLVRVGSQLATAPEAGSRVYVPDDDADLVRHILEAAGLPVLVVEGRHGQRAIDAIEIGELELRPTSQVEAIVRVGGVPLEPESGPGAMLVDDLAPWLPPLVAVVLEQQPSEFRTVTAASLQQALARLRRVRLVIAPAVSVHVDEHVVDVSAIGQGALHLDHPSDPLIVLRGAAEEGPAWLELARIADHLAALIGFPSASDTLRAAALSLDRTLDGTWREPSAEEVAEACQTTANHVREVWLSLGGHIDHLMRYVAVEVAWRLGVAAARSLADAKPKSTQELMEALDTVLPTEVDRRGVVERAERASTLRELWDQLQADLGEFNLVLRELDLPPLHFTDRHRAAFHHHVARRRDEIIDRLREGQLATFRNSESLTYYVEARRLTSLAPDAAWLDAYEEPPEDLMQDRVEAWLEAHDAPPVATGALAPLTEVRAANTARVNDVLEQARAVVAAWVLAHPSDRPAGLGTADEVVRSLHDIGALDFEPLDQPSTLRWLRAVSAWPDGMPLSLDLGELGLPPDSLTRGRDEAERERAALNRSRGHLIVGGSEYDATEEGYRTLARDIMAEVDTLGVEGTKVMTPLQPMRQRRGRGKKAGDGSGTGRRAANNLSDSQRAAIGLIGEAVAYRWLLAQYPSANEDSWVSGYRQHVLGGHEGDDTLGYDFVVHLRSRTLFFEVKATPGDSTEFELGTSELRAARDANKDVYRLLFLRYALEPARRTLLVLPNPLQPEHRSRFAQVNHGVRLRFEPARG